VDDPLIDLDIKDIIDVVRVYSTFSKSEERHLFIPKLFNNEDETEPQLLEQNQLQTQY
jgi:hypothetical protein